MGIKITPNMLTFNHVVRARVSNDPKVEARANKIVQEIIAPRVEEKAKETPPEAMTIEQLADELQEYESAAPDSYEYMGAYSGERSKPSWIPDRLVAEDFPWDESQLEAIIGLVGTRAGCLIGAAGTGKTTCEKKIVDMLIHGEEKYGVEPLRLTPVNVQKYWTRDQGKVADTESAGANVIPSILLCSYTGQATQNIKKNFPREWHKNIMTIHSALGYHPEEYEITDPDTQRIKRTMRFVPGYTKFNKMPWDVIIMDEASMTNLILWHELLDAAKVNCRFYFIGDINQLPPPIGQGILAYAMSKLPVFELRHIHRQKEPAANRIIETAWKILHGEQPELDDAKTNKEWRVIGMELQHGADAAAQQIIGVAKALRNLKISVPNEDGSVQSDYPVYDPWRDRILTCMNGFNLNAPSAPLGQAPLNEVLASLFSNSAERTIIDAGREIKRFAVGYRVMATKNEPPSRVDRVTNGMTGIIEEIGWNESYTGDRRLFGQESSVAAARKELLAQAFKSESEIFEEQSDLSTMNLKINIGAKDDRIQGAASHYVQVNFNGIVRVFKTKAELESLQIAYVSTVHKTQGSEMDTAIVIVHHSQKMMLCRESLYTAVTRATKRLILLYTPHGMKLSLAKQKIFGNTIQEKVKKYIQLMEEENALTNGTEIRLPELV